MKNFLIITLFITTIAFSQWNSKWSSNAINYNTVSGYFQFNKVNNKWEYKFYSVDSAKFIIMDSQFSMNPLYTYNFTPEEKTAGGQIYSLDVDLSGDNKMDFYVLAYYGVSTNYRQAIKILDISTGAVLFELNNPSYYYSSPEIFDVDNDGYYECIVARYNYPDFASYVMEVYNTGVQTSLTDENLPSQISFELKQNYPNPFNPETKIRYTINSPGVTKIFVYNSTGELVNTLVNQYQEVGSHEIIWNGTTNSGSKLPSGVYFYELQLKNQKDVKKMIILK